MIPKLTAVPMKLSLLPGRLSLMYIAHETIIRPDAKPNRSLPIKIAQKERKQQITDPAMQIRFASKAPFLLPIGTILDAKRAPNISPSTPLLLIS